MAYYNNLKIALVHDDLIQWGGAERVLAALSELFPDAPIYTSLCNYSKPQIKQFFGKRKIVTSFMQKIPFSKYLYKSLLPLYPIAFEQFDFSQYDLVISQTTRFAKAIITKPNTLHISYVHTPPRFLWNFSGESYPKILSPFFKYLKNFDLVSSNRVDLFIAGSKNAQTRIKNIYAKTSQVVLPFVDLERFKNVNSFEGGYYLIIARLNNYKRVDIAIKAFKGRNTRLKIVGHGPAATSLKRIASSNIEFLGGVTEELLAYLIAGCKGLIVSGEEDFGLTPLEVQIMGKGVIAYKAGGALETVKENITGVFFENQTVEDLNKAIDKYESLSINKEECIKNAEAFSKQRFLKEFEKIVQKATEHI